jgi:hypothetical protein
MERKLEPGYEAFYRTIYNDKNIPYLHSLLPMTSLKYQDFFDLGYNIRQFLKNMHLAGKDELRLLGLIPFDFPRDEYSSDYYSVEHLYQVIRLIRSINTSRSRLTITVYAEYNLRYIHVLNTICFTNERYNMFDSYESPIADIRDILEPNELGKLSAIKFYIVFAQHSENYQRNLLPYDHREFISRLLNTDSHVCLTLSSRVGADLNEKITKWFTEWDKPVEEEGAKPAAKKNEDSPN